MKKIHSGPQIVAKLRQANVLLGQSKSIPEVCKDLEISDKTYYHWRQKYGGMNPDMIKQFRALQKENSLFNFALKYYYLKTIVVV